MDLHYNDTPKNFQEIEILVNNIINDTKSQFKKISFSFFLCGLIFLSLFVYHHDRDTIYFIYLIGFCFCLNFTFIPYLLYYIGLYDFIKQPYKEISKETNHNIQAFLSQPGMESWLNYYNKVLLQNRLLYSFESEAIIKAWNNLIQ